MSDYEYVTVLRTSDSVVICSPAWMLRLYFFVSVHVCTVYVLRNVCHNNITSVLGLVKFVSFYMERSSS